jgi:para-aminobenzoate synthetase component 1
VELERIEWRDGDPGDPATLLAGFLDEHGLGGPLTGQRGDRAVALLAGAAGCARLAGLPPGRPSPVPAVPELVAVACTAGPGPATPPAGAHGPVAGWRTTWSDAEHAASVEQVRSAIARGDVYQANVVGHRTAAHRSDPRALAATVSRLPGAVYGSVLSGAGWAVGCASPEQLVRVDAGRITTVPIKGTLPVAPGSREALLASEKDRAEHIMIVDLQRNDLSRVARTGSVEVERLYELVDWSGLWQAASTVAARTREDVTVTDVLRALAPGGSVTGAPKRAACEILGALEPVGRGPSMGALGLLWPGGLDLGLTIRTVGVDEDAVHLWAGGGITWSSDPVTEVSEAHAKAGPVLRALG